MSSPSKTHWNAAIHVLKYLRGIINHGLFYPYHNNMNLKGYSDADWASCTDTRRPITSYCIYLGESLISWKKKKQPTVSRSSTEAEYRALTTTTCKLQWISYLLRDLQVIIPLPIPLYCDSQSAFHITANPVFHERTKYLDIDCHVVRNQYKDGFVLPSHVLRKLQ